MDIRTPLKVTRTLWALLSLLPLTTMGCWWAGDVDPIDPPTFGGDAEVAYEAEQCLLEEGVPKDCIEAYLKMAVWQHRVVPSLGTFNEGEIEQWSRIVCLGFLQRVESIVPNSSESVPAKSPDIPWTAIWSKLKPGVARGAVDSPPPPLRSGRVGASLVPGECGDTEDGLVLCASSVFPGDRALVTAMVMDETIPLADPERIHQFAFVFDSDGDPSNNYQASSAYPNDFFHNTDLWFVANYTPQAGWSLDVSIASGSTITPVSSDARLIIDDNSMVLMVPPEEFAVECPPYRMTSFTHTGDYGQSPPYDWSGDVEPAVHEPLSAECLTYDTSMP